MLIWHRAEEYSRNAELSDGWTSFHLVDLKGLCVKRQYVVSALVMLTACNPSGDPKKSETKPSVAEPADRVSLTKFVEVEDRAPLTPIVQEQMLVQVMLDRAGFSPGVIDGKGGQTFKLAISGFQTANDLDPSGSLDVATRDALSRLPKVSATRLVRIPAEFARQSFMPDLPGDPVAQARLPNLGYRNLMEALAERFHTTTGTLVALNPPETLVGVNRVIRVPNIAEVPDAPSTIDQRGWNKTLQSLAVDASQAEAAKVVVDKSQGVLKVFDKSGHLIAQFPATMGSRHDPLPLGKWKIQGVSRNPDFHYNPKLFWDVSDRKEAVLLKPGANGPVGVAWLDLSKPHYGIHGTSEPQTIGRSESHGCVRLTNWDAARLAQMVKSGIPAIFQS